MLFIPQFLFQRANSNVSLLVTFIVFSSRSVSSSLSILEECKVNNSTLSFYFINGSHILTPTWIIWSFLLLKFQRILQSAISVKGSCSCSYHFSITWIWLIRRISIVIFSLNSHATLYFFNANFEHYISKLFIVSTTLLFILNLVSSCVQSTRMLITFVPVLPWYPFPNYRCHCYHCYNHHHYYYYH